MKKADASLRGGDKCTVFAGGQDSVKSEAKHAVTDE
jgi:hypothetical protein